MLAWWIHVGRLPILRNPCAKDDHLQIGLKYPEGSTIVNHQPYPTNWPLTFVPLSTYTEVAHFSITAGDIPNESPPAWGMSPTVLHTRQPGQSTSSHRHPSESEGCTMAYLMFSTELVMMNSWFNDLCYKDTSASHKKHFKKTHRLTSSSAWRTRRCHFDLITKWVIRIVTPLIGVISYNPTYPFILSNLRSHNPIYNTRMVPTLHHLTKAPTPAWLQSGCLEDKHQSPTRSAWQREKAIGPVLKLLPTVYNTYKHVQNGFTTWCVILCECFSYELMCMWYDVHIFTDWNWDACTARQADLWKQRQLKALHPNSPHACMEGGLNRFKACAIICIHVQNHCKYASTCYLPHLWTCSTMHLSLQLPLSPLPLVSFCYSNQFYALICVSPIQYQWCGYKATSNQLRALNHNQLQNP